MLHTQKMYVFFTEMFMLCRMLPVTLRMSACVWFSSILFIAIKNCIPLFFRSNTPHPTNEQKKDGKWEKTIRIQVQQYNSAFKWI